ncbi:DNA-binding IclR family transcriptional regulator [Actinoalloteichus hoggarensis]|uniref:HTH-type transcriptional regulator KipR n=1 Tax=Actinoalloteichus hoggarensis TaxID=1470176 RepID=A0A221VYV0_9PSEU|nr:IclR family transcriptional regulator [Actinoalloteichus hoggarensis]ASO18709.1 HTH-type transcriptional regulator KipR [Actinoalloteichus hoggarensis]MBB5919942.1 DNA-binding IclR family transcriptional regulator [Actinoalloteichus hoggarensis]
MRSGGADTPEGDGGGIRAVSRAFRVLGAFSVDRMSLGVAEIVRSTGLPRTTVLRLIETLQAEGLLEFGADGQVRVGTRMIGLAAFAEAAWTLPAASLARMRELAAATGETVSLYVRRGLRRVVVGQAPSPNMLRHVVQTGDELPMWGGSAAFVLLGLEAPDDREELIQRVARLPESRSDADAIRRSVDQAVADGWYISHGQREPGNTGLAVPMLPDPNADGGVPVRPAVLALGGPTIRFTEDRIPGFVAAVRACADDIARTGLPPALH